MEPVGAYSAHTGRGGHRAARLATGTVLAALLTALGLVAGPAALAATPATGSAGAAAAQAPAGTVTQTDGYLADDAGRAFVPHGLTLPAGVRPTATDLDAWVRAGFDAAGVTIPLTAAGQFLDPATGATANDPGLAAAAGVTRVLTNRGFVVVLRVAPVGAGTVAAAASQASLSRLAAAFRDTGGLIGYELPRAQTKDVGAVRAASDAIAAVDPFHRLWREQPASFQPAATVAVNDPTGFLVAWPGGGASWPGSGDQALGALAATADGNTIGWLSPAPVTGAPVPAALARPYPVAIAGTRASFGVDATGTLSLRYAAATLPGGRPTPAGWVTAVSLPAAAYPTGYAVRLTGARLLSRPGSALLCVAAEPGAAQVSLTVTRTAAGQPPAAAPYAGARACADPAVTAPPSAAPASPAARTTAAAKSDYSGPLLWALPLLGAAVMGLLLVVPFRMLRGLRVGTAGGRTGDPPTGAGGDDDTDRAGSERPDEPPTSRHRHRAAARP